METSNRSNPDDLAKWSLRLGMLSVFFGFPAGVPAIICGHLARSKARHSRIPAASREKALAGLGLGYTGTLFTSFILFSVVSIISSMVDDDPMLFYSRRDRANCLRVQVQAQNTSAALYDYLSIPDHDTLPSEAALLSDPDLDYTPLEEVEIIITGDAQQIQITAIDKIGKCRLGSRFVLSMPGNPEDGWRK